MTRRSQVVRSASRAGPGNYRDLNSTIIHCVNEQCYRDWIGHRIVASIAVVARDPYQRFFASATINDARARWPNDTPDGVLIRLGVSDGNDFSTIKTWTTTVVSPAITGAIDLPAGSHTIELTMTSETALNYCSYQGFTMQVIEGQVVVVPGCLAPNPPN